jgi:hypothetical protein
MPFLLAGPIVRRVEPTRASVWVVTNAACAVGLHVWPGEVAAGTGADVFKPGGEAAIGRRDTIRIGEKIHVAVVTAQTPEPAQPDDHNDHPEGPSFLPGARYSYNVTFDVVGQQLTDLHKLGLLQDTPLQPMLGYRPNVLPSFATCPLSIDQLVLLHGSCNRIDADGGPNLMFAIDDMIEASLDDPTQRPHQLWLSGDQVYSDEVSAVLSPRITALGRDLIGVDELIELTVEGAPSRVPLRQVNFPAGYRQKLMQQHARLTSSEAASHLLGLTERLAMQLLLWSPEVWGAEGSMVGLEPASAVLRAKEPPLLEALEDLPPGMTPAQSGATQVFLAKNLTTFASDRDLAKAVKDADDEGERILAYVAKVGRIRRALANVATYLVFDDHDVTDDWNLCQLWKDQVYGNPLGRSVIRDGLTTFAITQGWGNNPGAYDSGPGAEILAAASRLFPQTGTGPDLAAAADLDRLFGLAGEPPIMRWHYQIDGAAHRVIACDTRTRRGYTGPVSPPIQLPDGERELQIPHGPAESGIEVVIVVLSQPLLDPVLLGELTQGLVARGVAAFGQVDNRMITKGDAKAMAGLETLDYEGWGARPAEIPRLLDRLATYPRVVILSGDVHFSVSLGLSFWRRAQGLVSVIGQLTSSAVQYITYPEVLLPALGQGWAAQLIADANPAEFLVWTDPAEVPITSPSLPGRDLRRRLMHRPIIVPTTGWPDATETHVPPDFAYRIDLLADTRADEIRPEPVRNDPLDAEFDTQDPLHGANGYPALARRHMEAVSKHANTRRIGIFNKIARLTFRHTDPPNARLLVRSELMSIDHFGETPAAPAPFTVHELEFDQPVDSLAPRIRQ